MHVSLDWCCPSAAHLWCAARQRRTCGVREGLCPRHDASGAHSRRRQRRPAGSACGRAWRRRRCQGSPTSTRATRSACSVAIGSTKLRPWSSMRRPCCLARSSGKKPGTPFQTLRRGTSPTRPSYRPKCCPELTCRSVVQVRPRKGRSRRPTQAPPAGSHRAGGDPRGSAVDQTTNPPATSPKTCNDSQARYRAARLSSNGSELVTAAEIWPVGSNLPMLACGAFRAVHSNGRPKQRQLG